MALEPIQSERLRIDKWLWFARQVKTRSVAQQLVRSGNVRLNREKVSNPAKLIAAGDVLTVRHTNRVRVLFIKRCGTRRGPFSEASQLYEILSETDVWPAANLGKPNAAPLPGPKPSRREIRHARKLSGKE